MAKRDRKKKATAKKAKATRGAEPMPRRPVVMAQTDPQRNMTELLLLSVIESMRTEAKRGPKMDAWKVEESELFDAAKRYCLLLETQEEVVAEARPDLDAAKVSGRALVSWLTEVRKQYRQKLLDVRKGQLDSGELSRMAVEQVDQQHIVQTKINTKLLAAIENVDLVNDDLKRLHVLSRWLAHGTDVAKVRADAQLKAEQAKLAEAKAKQLADRVTALAAQVETGKDERGNRFTPEQIAQMIRVAAMGGDVKAHAERLAQGEAA